MPTGELDYCRLCADPKSNRDLVTIRARSRPAFEALLLEVFRIDLFANNSSLPRTVCTKCIDNVRMIGKFRKKVAKSQQALSSIFDVKLQQMKTEVEPNEAEDVQGHESADNSNGGEDDVESSTLDTDTKGDCDLSDGGTEPTAGLDGDFETEDAEGMEFFHDGDSGQEGDVKGSIDENDEYKPTAPKRVRKKRKKADLDEKVENLSTFEDVQVNDEDFSLRLSLDNNVWESYPWKCITCPEVFDSIIRLQEHYKNDHNVVNIEQGVKFSCYDCPKVYLKFYSFKLHVVVHRSYLKFGCEVCGKFFQNRRALVNHRGTAHKELLKFQCNVCGKWFNTKTYLQTHQNVHLPLDQRSKYECKQCDKVFSTKNGLTAHIQTHNGIREFVCEHCGKDFLRKAGLEEHLQTHSDVRPFKCEACGRTFKSNVILKLHFQIHTGYKKHECDVCGRKYRKKCSLHQHYRIHTGDMPFTCEFCGKNFRFKGVYQTHRYTHTGERPYSCSECEHFFTNWPNYNKHMKRKHGIDKSNRVKDNLPPSEDKGQNKSNDIINLISDVISVTSEAIRPVPSAATTVATNSTPSSHSSATDFLDHHPSIIKLYDNSNAHIDTITTVTTNGEGDNYFRVWN